MALIKCPECQKQVSNLAVSCPHCGIPLACPECGHMHVSVEALPKIAAPVYETGFRIMTAVTVVLAAALLWFILRQPVSNTSTVNQPIGSGTTAGQDYLSGATGTAATTLPGQQDSDKTAPAAEISKDSSPHRGLVSGAVSEPDPAPDNEIIVRLTRSNSADPELIPEVLISALAKGFLLKEGAKDVQIMTKETEAKTTVEGTFDTDPSFRSITITTESDRNAFKRLAVRKADVAFTTERISADQAARLKARYDTLQPLDEQVFALDSLVFIVHPDNPVSMLSRDQLAAIYSGIITDWQAVQGKPGKINVYGLDYHSWQFEMLKTRILGNLHPTESAKLFETQSALANSVEQDVNSIGFVSLAQTALANSVEQELNRIGFVSLAQTAQAKKIGTLVSGSIPLVPNPYTVASRVYPFTQPLYLYSQVDASNFYAMEFLTYLDSADGRSIVAQQGFVTPGAATGTGAGGEYTSDYYYQLTENALQLSTNLVFESRAASLSANSLGDVDRVTTFLKGVDLDKHSLMVFGFSDAAGLSGSNLRLSERRALAVAAALKKRGIAVDLVTGFGSLYPVADNDTEKGRLLNRRVEIWLKKDSEGPA